MSEADTKDKKAPAASPYAEPGWPEQCDLPYRAPAWYAQHGLEPPRPIDVGVTAANLSVEDATRLKDSWGKETLLRTYVLLWSKPHRLPIPGPSVGSTLWVEVLPFGAISTTPSLLTSFAVQPDSRTPMFVQIGAKGDCRGGQILEDKEQPGVKIETCKLFGCPRHPLAEEVAKDGSRRALAHSIHQAYLYVGGIGEPLDDARDPSHRARYIPPLDWAEKRCHEYMELDRRPLVQAWVGKRLHHLHKREAVFNVRARRGEFVAGR